ncbi:MAG: tRNA adenosine(34) deaminase TadA [Gammaproteobacteria bacterium]|nr:tRNA adenosine(34) deaminase TadA [Gammaproteobacteria bacterium]
MNDIQFMRRALILAQRAQALDEVPVGALLVKDERIIGEGFNSVRRFNDPTAHAECQAIRNASLLERNYRLPGTTLYVTIEPCVMCIGCMIHARIQRLVFGAREPKSGAVVSKLAVLDLPHWNHRITVKAGVLEKACAELIHNFFARRRTESTD